MICRDILTRNARKPLRNRADNTRAVLTLLAMNNDRSSSRRRTTQRSANELCVACPAAIILQHAPARNSIFPNDPCNKALRSVFTAALPKSIVSQDHDIVHRRIGIRCNLKAIAQVD